MAARRRHPAVVRYDGLGNVNTDRVSEELHMPRVSVVLPTCKRPRLVQGAIASVQAQTLTDWELIVTDDEDPPGETWTHLVRLADEDPRVRICRNSGSHGQSGNVNNGLRRARAPWVKILYDDDVLRPGCLATLLDAVGEDGSVAVATCLCDRYRSGRLTRRARCSRTPIERIPQKTVHLAMYLQDVDIGIPTQTMVNRTCIDRGILFEDHFGLVSGVDTWWFARLLQHGDLVIVNEALVEQHQGEHATVTSGIDEAALDAEFEMLRELILPLIDPRLDPPPLHVANQSLRLIRASHRLAIHRPRDALRLAATAGGPQAWYLAARWLLRRTFPGRFEIVQRNSG
jgi:hypothetical protein